MPISGEHSASPINWVSRLVPTGVPVVSHRPHWRCVRRWRDGAAALATAAVAFPADLSNMVKLVPRWVRPPDLWKVDRLLDHWKMADEHRPSQAWFRAAQPSFGGSIPATSRRSFREDGRSLPGPWLRSRDWGFGDLPRGWSLLGASRGGGGTC